MIQKVDNLKKGDLVVILGQFQDEIAIYIKHTIRDKIVISIDYKSFNGRAFNESIRTRHSTKQRIYKITEDNLTILQLDIYKSILIELGISSIPDYLTLKDGSQISKASLYRNIENGHKMELVKNMTNSNHLGLKRNKEIADELFHNPDELIKTIFINNIIIND